MQIEKGWKAWVWEPETGDGCMIAIWEQRLSTGDKVIDAEHRLVLNLLNELSVALTVNAPAVVVQKALEALVRAIDRHFARDGLTAVGSVERAPIGEHAALAAKAHRLLADWQSGTVTKLERRSLLSLGQRWIGHMGRHEAPTLRPGLGLTATPDRLAG